MKKVSCLIVFLAACLTGHAQEDLSVNNYWTYNGIMTNALYETVCSHAFTRLNQRWSYVGGLKSQYGWENRQADVRKLLKEIVGAFPAKTPLNPVITGTVKKDGFVIEKLYFESRPGFYVSGALFIPTGKKGKLPAIIYCSGHSGSGFVYYQNAILNLVKKGFIVFAFDTIGQGERLQYFDADGKSWPH